MNCFNRFVLNSDTRQTMPIAVYPGIALTGARVCDIVNGAVAQFAAERALHERYQTPFVLSAMDLSTEAEAFGCALHISDHEVPSVTGRLVATLGQATALTAPEPGARRTGVYLDTVRHLRGLAGNPLVFGGCIGPFSLAARIIGVSETMELTVTDPELVRVVLDRTAAFLANYIHAFHSAGADGVIMAEPAAGLLSPRGMAQFSSAYIRQIAGNLPDESFALILHNCAARLIHLPAVLETGLETFHFGAPMDIAGALEKVPSNVVLCGNLDPSSIFCQAGPEQVADATAALLAVTAGHRNFVLSSGCDIPGHAPLQNLDAFYETAGNAISSA